MNLEFKNSNVYIKGIEDFDLPHTLDCGQAFRWKMDENGVWNGVAFGKKLTLEKFQNGTVVLYNTNKEDYENIWKDYFDLERDYTKIIDVLSENETLKKACEYSFGIRILNQEPFETLCSFIISQNNNIPRIKGIIERLCEEFGDGEAGKKTFPSAEIISTLTVEDLAPLRAGFRAKYILDAAQKVASGEIDFKKIDENPIEFGREELQKIKGVGAKVAECTLLYGFHKIDAFPIDVWVKRIMAEMYPNGLPECTKGTEGIAQQYLFHWRRMQDR